LQGVEWGYAKDWNIENDWNPGRQLQENLYPHHEYNFSSEKAQYKIN